MKDFKYILFDLDGTITDSAKGITDSVKYALKKMGEKIPPYETLCRFIGPPLKTGFSEFCGMSDKAADRAVEYYREYYHVKGVLDCEVYPGIPALLEKLQGAGKRAVLATSKPEKFAKIILEHFGLSKYFYFIGGASFDDTRNEKYQVIEYVINACGIKDKTAAVMVGDRFHDIEGAKFNGISTVGVLYGFGNRKELENAGADAIAESVSALESILL